MAILKTKLFASTVFTVIASAALLACGGGGSAVMPEVTPADPITTASNNVASNIGAKLIAGASSDEEIYNLAADIGDTWQLILNNKTNTYVIKVLSTQFGLSSTTAAAFTKTTVGTISTISSTANGVLNVQLDTRTKTVSGNATVGAKKATVAGTGYTVASTTLLAGNYFFTGATRNALDGLFPDNPSGSLIVAANGTDITVCDRGIVVNGACAPVPGSGSQVITPRLLKVSKDSATGLLTVKDGVKDFGVLHVSAGDRGPVLLIDRFGLNDANVLRTGVIFAGKIAKLAGTEFNGNFNCSRNGIDSSNVVVTGTTYSGIELQNNNRIFSGTLQFNKIVSGNRLQTIDIDGAAIAKNSDETLAQSSLVLPLSSSLALVSDFDGSLNICRRAS